MKPFNSPNRLNASASAWLTLRFHMPLNMSQTGYQYGYIAIGAWPSQRGLWSIFLPANRLALLAQLPQVPKDNSNREIAE